ncbi:MAG: carboxymuconolactone decarboxylase family protein [Bacteroidota bacterium]
MERISFKDLPQGMFEKLMAVESLVNGASLDFQLLELARLRVSQINGCAYCVDMHYKELKHAGETDLRLSSLVVWEETDYFTEREEAVLAFAEQLTLVSEKGVSDKLFEQLAQHFEKQEIALLTLAVAQINTWTRLMRTFRFTPGKYRVQQAA